MWPRGLMEREEPWEPVSRVSLVGWLAAYVLFFVYALTHRNQFLLVDNVNLIVHEAGHALFSWLGETASLYGGTVLQFFVPLALSFYFWRQRKTTAFAFTRFWTFENCLYTATYMADARAQALPLVTVGDPESGGHDWATIFTHWGLLQHDTAIAALVRGLGVLGMLAVMGWLTYRHTQAASERQQREVE